MTESKERLLSALAEKGTSYSQTTKEARMDTNTIKAVTGTCSLP
ncbi:MAG: hypothetical protein ACHQ1D_04010 [Nitrososphaerales archaeon]